MLMIAAMGVFLPINLALGRAFLQWTPFINLSTLLAWIVIGALACGLALRQGFLNLWRYSLCGWTRPHWWFEIARIGLLISVFSVLLLVMLMLIPIQAGAFITGESLALLAGFFGPIAFLASSIGYVFAWTTGIRLRRKSFQCVHFFYCTIIPIAAMTLLAMLWPQPAFWPGGLLVMLGFLITMSLWTFGLLSLISHYEKHSS